MEEAADVSIVHASRLIREGLRDLLRSHPQVRVHRTLGEAREVLEGSFAEGHILLYDLGTAQRDGTDRMLELHRRLPGVKVLIFNVADDDRMIVECVRVGAAGCILQDASLEELVSAIQSVQHGTPPHSPRIITSLFSYVASLERGEDRAPPTPLTPREEQILQLVAQGLSNKEIARTLYLQPQTVKNYVHMILQKLDLHSRLEIIRHLRAGRR